MKGEQRSHERRRAARVRAHGGVVIGGDRNDHGEIVDLSATGIRFRFAGAVGWYRPEDRVDLALRFDGAKGGWWGMSGRIVRVDQSDIVVAFDRIPTDFEDWMQAELVAALEAADGKVHILLVDPVAVRRGDLAASMRAAGRHVSEAATPLDAIDHLGESRNRPDMVAIADTVPVGIADDLRAYVRAEHPDLGLVRTKAVTR
jgi:hypothetical protein